MNIEKQKLSVIIPVYNEAKNIPILMRLLEEVLIPYDYEIIAVDDGSQDSSFENLKDACKKNKRVKTIRLNKNCGQTTAISAGIQYAHGDNIVLMDSDLENDPRDIIKLLDKLKEGFDVVSGWRQNRWKNKWLTRKIPSQAGNRLISYICGLKLNDYGCTLKAYKKEIIKGISLYGEMHRFIPIYCYWKGGKISEVPVRFNERVHGDSHYGIGRTIRVMLDLILMKFFDKFMQRPIHFFGGIGFFSFTAGGLTGIISVILKIFFSTDFVATPLPILSVFFIFIGILFILMGVIAEVLMRTYYESQNKDPFIIKEKINFS
jgi:glycosyltransferase involved in cell wall biosynthesis